MKRTNAWSCSWTTSKKPPASFPKTSSIKSASKSSKESPMKNANDNSSKPSTSNLTSKASKTSLKTSSTPKKSPNKKSNKSLKRPTTNFDNHSLFLIFILFVYPLFSPLFSLYFIILLYFTHSFCFIILQNDILNYLYKVPNKFYEHFLKNTCKTSWAIINGCIKILMDEVVCQIINR